MEEIFRKQAEKIEKGGRRGKKEWRKNNISSKDWKRHFISLLEGTRTEKEEEV